MLLDLLPLIPPLLSSTRATIPPTYRVPHDLVGHPRVVTELVPAIVAPVAEHDLVGSWAMHAATLLAEHLLDSTLAVVVGWGARPFAGSVHGCWVVGRWLKNLTAGLGDCKGYGSGWGARFWRW